LQLPAEKAFADPLAARRLCLGYYAATALFLLLDYGFSVNIRVAFLKDWPAWRLAYYGILFACLAIVAWRPALAVVTTTLESLLTLVALIVSMGVRVMLPPAGFDTGAGAGAVVSIQEIVNFAIAGGMAWYGWVRGAATLRAWLHL